MTILVSKRILLGVTGGISAYKSVEFVRLLRGSGAHVNVLMTDSATRFVTPLTFETLTRQPVPTDVFQQWTETEAGHVTLAEQADVLVIAPATANMIAKLAHGLADDMLTVSALACPGPAIVAPAMDHHMYLHPATQANLDVLRARGVEIVGPEQGELASGLTGHGRLVEPESLVGAIRWVLGRNGRLTGRHVVVSSGATRESIDPIRFISNRSTGRMGHAIAQAAIDAGARTTLITGPVGIPAPWGVDVIEAESASDMYQAVQSAVVNADALIMAAAVGDYAPSEPAKEKIKKDDREISITLNQTVDILASTHRPALVKVGFAAETTNLEEHARAKLERKGVQLLVANDAVSTMGSADNQATLFRVERDPERLPLMSKEELAQRLMEEVAMLIEREQDTHATTANS